MGIGLVERGLGHAPRGRGEIVPAVNPVICQAGLYRLRTFHSPRVGFVSLHSWV